MKRLFIAVASILALAGSSAAGVSLNPQSAPKGVYRVDPKHASVVFCIRHMDISNYCGRFSGVTGKINFNGSQPEKSSASIELDVASVNTPTDSLSAELRRAFFETDKFPKASFVSTSIKLTGKSTAEITGDLTLHGVTRPATLVTTFNGGLQHPLENAYAIGFSAATKLDIADFNFPDVDWKIFIADDVSLKIEAEFIAEK
ncbi:MAG: YceI family protein [Micropepsaceae bacterium]